MATAINSFLTFVSLSDVRSGAVVYRESAVSAVVRGDVDGEAFTLALRVGNGGQYHYHGAFAVVGDFAYQRMGGTSLGFNGGTFYCAVAIRYGTVWQAIDGAVNLDGFKAAEFTATPVAQFSMLAHYLGGVIGAPKATGVWKDYEKVPAVLSDRGRLVTNPNGIEGIRQRGRETAGGPGNVCGGSKIVGPMRPRG